MSDFPRMGVPPSDIPGMKARAAQRYPTLAPMINDAVVQWGDPANNPNGGYLEFFPPWESYNPNPGKTTLELYRPQMQGDRLVQAIAGDMMHASGSIDPRTSAPVDPQFYGMKAALRGTLTPEQLAVDQRTYDQTEANTQGNPRLPRPFENWMQDSRTDAYIRGYITPDENNDWKNVYTPEQRSLLDGVKQYLQQGMKPDPMGVIGNRGIWDSTIPGRGLF